MTDTYESPTMADEIKPVAYGVIDATMGIVITFPFEFMCHEHINDAINEHQLDDANTWTVRPIYDSAALAQARKEGEIKGMREAMEICKSHASRLSAGAGYAISFAVEEINRAIQEKSK